MTALTVSLAYFIYDSICCLVELPFDIEVTIHHILTITGLIFGYLRAYVRCPTLSLRFLLFAIFNVLYLSLIMWHVWKVFENLCAHLKPSLTLFSYLCTVEWDRAGGLFDAHGGFKSLHAWSRDIEGAKTQRFIFESHEWCRHLNLIASTLCIGCIASLFFSFFDLLKCWQCCEV